MSKTLPSHKYYQMLASDPAMLVTIYRKGEDLDAELAAIV